MQFLCGTSRIELPRRPFDVRLGRPLDVISGRPLDVRLGRPRDGQIGSLGDALGTLIFADWDTNLNPKINEVKSEIPSNTNLATTTLLNVKLNEVKNKIPNITNLATTTALIAVENKIPNVSNFVKKTDFNTKISEVENKILTDHDRDKHITHEFHKLTSENFCYKISTSKFSKQKRQI